MLDEEPSDVDLVARSLMSTTSSTGSGRRTYFASLAEAMDAVDRLVLNSAVPPAPHTYQISRYIHLVRYSLFKLTKCP